MPPPTIEQVKKQHPNKSQDWYEGFIAFHTPKPKPAPWETEPHHSRDYYDGNFNAQYWHEVEQDSLKEFDDDVLDL